MRFNISINEFKKSPYSVKFVRNVEVEFYSEGERTYKFIITTLRNMKLGKEDREKLSHEF